VLFERHARGVSPTAAAQRLLPYALKIRQMLTDASKAARDNGTPAGPLLVGSLETTAAVRLAPLLASYVAAYRDVDLSLHTGTTCELIADVLAGRLEGAFVCGPVDHPELTAETMYQEELVALTAPGVSSLDSVIGKGGFRIIVLRAGCSYRLRLEAILARRAGRHSHAAAGGRVRRDRLRAPLRRLCVQRAGGVPLGRSTGAVNRSGGGVIFQRPL
jgi:DNA-binding transcriptional LysR family regulator